ncbi:UROD/MetE-like protein [Coprinellus micaceus]|uniref:UROD/MetE-like protein n=1 Tax=Coprinellus micaceus TaxID=71717 RepID=A0A4Y7TLX7_COPMI|nr:UROD/MetE-like protein [Coprinellus micaceus]
MHLTPPFRAEHREALEKGECTLEDVRALEDEAIKHIVGIKGITDGEIRREVFFENVFDNLEGMTFIPNRPLSEFKSYIPHIGIMAMMGMQESESFYCTASHTRSFRGKIKRTKPWYADEFKYTKSIVAPEDVKNIKITMCSPSWMHQRHGSDLTYDLSVYDNDDEYFDDLGAAYRAEIKELYDLGCPGVDHEALLDTYIRAINVCTQGRPDDLNVSVHMCRGNFKGGVHFSEGGYARIAVKVFNTLDVDTFYLEYDTDRSGDFEPLKYFPAGKVAVLGLVTTKSPKLESAEGIKARVHEAAEVMSKDNPNRSKQDALNQLCISTQCGFASVWQGNPLTEEDEKEEIGAACQRSLRKFGRIEYPGFFDNS